MTEQELFHVPEPFYPLSGSIGRLYFGGIDQIQAYPIGMTAEDIADAASQFTRNNPDTMALQTSENILEYLGKPGYAFPWVVKTDRGPYLLAMSKLKVWPGKKIAEEHNPEIHRLLFSPGAKTVLELSTVFCNPEQREEYRGVGKYYAYMVLSTARILFPNHSFIAVVRQENDDARQYFSAIGGKELTIFRYEDPIAEGVSGQKILFGLDHIQACNAQGQGDAYTMELGMWQYETFG